MKRPLPLASNTKTNLSKPTLKLTGLLLFATVLSGCASQLSKPGSASSSANTDLQPLQSTQPNTVATQNTDHMQAKGPSLGLDPVEEIHQRAITDPEQLVDASALHYDNLWHDIGANLTLTEIHKGRYSDYLTYYKKRPNYLKRVSKRAQPYLHFIVSEVKQRNMPMEMALLPIIESGFQTKAKSYQSAVGLWQFIPQTGHLYGLEKNWWYDGRQDIVKSTHAALEYLQKLYKLNKNDWLLALASYNGGIGNVWKAAKRYKKKHPHVEQPTFWQIQPYLPKETQHYVPQLLAVSYIIQHHEQLNQPLTFVANQPYLQVTELSQQIALDKAAELSGISNALMAQLNPGYLRPATPPKGPHHIVLPIENTPAFEQQLQNNAEVFKIQWRKHTIKSGDTLSEIAQNYKTSSRAIRQLNGMKNNRIRVGKTLLIPLPQQYAATFNISDQPSSYKGPKFFHQVKGGESLWTIAKYYNVSTQTLCKWNNIGVRTPLRKGQKLEIRSGQYGQKAQYTLKKGESLWTVAKKYNVTTTELASWNKIKRSKVLQPGMTLTVWQPKSKAGSKAKTSSKQQQRLLSSKHFKPYKVKSGDNLWLIAKANNVSTRVIARYNQIKESAFLKPGQILKIPYEQDA